MGTRNDSFLDLATVIVVLCEVCVCVGCGGDFFCNSLNKTLKPCFIVILCHER